MVAKEVLVNCYSFNPITYTVKKGTYFSRYLIKLSEAGARAGAGAGGAIRICGSTDPDPQH
jgi:hypothetical protein